jgi:hypothetical protein
MIDDVDEVMRQLLIQEMPIKNGEIDINFDQPRREWSARLSKPTLNLFLYDICENKKLRQTLPMWEVTKNNDGTATKRRRAVKTDLRYMITAWANEPEDEHRLLTRALLSLYRHAHLPDKLLADSLKNQPAPIAMMVAQEEELRNPADLWGAMDNEMRPSIVIVITLTLDPHRPLTTPLVRTREIRMGQSPEPRQRQIEPNGTDQFWTIGGRIDSKKPLEVLQVRLAEKALPVVVHPDGRFSIGNLKAGDYTLEISATGQKTQRHKLTVPSPDYEITI